MTLLEEVKEIHKGLNEMKLTKRTDYRVIDRTYHKVMEYLYDSRKYSRMAIFNVDGVDFYCVLLMRDIYLEPHFGRFFPDKLQEAKTALETNDKEKISALMKSQEFMMKDGETNTGTNLLKVLSYIFSILSDYLKEHPIAMVKIMGNARKYAIYENFVKTNISQIEHYSIIKTGVSDNYSDKEGNTLPAKAIILKYNFA